MAEPKDTKYQRLLSLVFHKYYQKGVQSFEFRQSDLVEQAISAKIIVKNIADIKYSFNNRTALPQSIIATQPDGREWVIKAGNGKGKLAFHLVPFSRISPQRDLALIEIPDATPDIIRENMTGDEQSLLAIVRYNRLIDIFLGIVTYSLQNHLRTTVNNSQIEIDEIYVGIDTEGTKYIIPVEAKGGEDKNGIVQLEQEINYCAQNYSSMKCRAVAVKFLASRDVVLFELILSNNVIKIKNEKHYRLVRKP